MADSGDSGSEQTSLKTEFIKLLPQLLMITLGGAIVSAVFQYFGQIRDERAQQAAFEKQNFLALHRDISTLIANRVIVMDRVKARLASGDYAGALLLKRTDYDQAVAAWNQNIDRLLRALKKVAVCRPSQSALPDGCTAGTAAPKQDCLIDYYYDIGWDEKRRDTSGEVCRPRSVHFALKNAGYKLTALFSSDWSDCLELNQALIDRVKEECRKQPLDGYSQAKFDDIIHCLDKVKDMRASGVKTCNAKAGYELNTQLTADLEYARTRWAALDEWLTQIEQKFGAPVADAGAKAAEEIVGGSRR
jgi:hypothetical protein